MAWSEHYRSGGGSRTVEIEQLGHREHPLRYELTITQRGRVRTTVRSRKTVTITEARKLARDFVNFVNPK